MQKSIKLKRRYFSILVIISFFSLISIAIHNKYIELKCKDLYFATEYQMTKGNSENRLLRVQTLELIFLDNDLAIMKVSGLNKNFPHESTTYKAYFNKNNNDSWELDKTLKF